MELKKTRFCGKHLFFFGVCSLVLGAALFLLTLTGVIHKQSEDPELSEVISYLFAMIFFTIYMMIQAFASICSAVFGGIITKAVEKNKKLRAFLIVSAIVEALFATVCGINVFLMFGFGFVFGGVFCLLCMLGGVACTVTCALAAKENKKYFAYT